MTPARRAQCRAAQKRYEQTPKGKAAKRRYLATEAGRAVLQRCGARRVLNGRQYLGRVATVEQAQAINAHIKERVREFKQGQP